MDIRGRVLLGGDPAINLRAPEAGESGQTSPDVDAAFYDRVESEIGKVLNQYSATKTNFGCIVNALKEGVKQNKICHFQGGPNFHVIVAIKDGQKRIYVYRNDQKDRSGLADLQNLAKNKEWSFSALEEKGGAQLSEIHGESLAALLCGEENGEEIVRVKVALATAINIAIGGEFEKFKILNGHAGQHTNNDQDKILVARNIGRQIADLGRRISDLQTLLGSDRKDELETLNAQLADLQEQFANGVRTYAEMSIAGDLNLGGASKPAAIKPQEPITFRESQSNKTGRANSWYTYAQRAMASKNERIGKMPQNEAKFKIGGREYEGTGFPSATECLSRYYDLEFNENEEGSMVELRSLIEGYFDSKEFEHIVDGTFQFKSEKYQIDAGVILTHLPKVAAGLDLLYAKGKISKAKYVTLITEVRIAAFQAAKKADLITAENVRPDCSEFRKFFSEGRVLRGVSDMTAKHIERVHNYLNGNSDSIEVTNCSIEKNRNNKKDIEAIADKLGMRISKDQYVEGMAGKIAQTSDRNSAGGGLVVGPNQPLNQDDLQRAFFYLASAGTARYDSDSVQVSDGVLVAGDQPVDRALLVVEDLEPAPPEEGVFLFSALTKLDENLDRILNCDPEHPSEEFTNFLNELTARDHRGQLRIDRDITAEPEKVLENLKTIVEKGIRQFQPAGVDGDMKTTAMTNLFHVAHIISQAYARKFPLDQKTIEARAEALTSEKAAEDKPLVRENDRKDQLFREIQQLRRNVFDPFLNDRQTDLGRSNQPTEKCKERFERLGVKGQAHFYLAQLELLEECAAFQHHSTRGRFGANGIAYDRAPRYCYSQSADPKTVAHEGADGKPFSPPLVDANGKYQHFGTLPQKTHELRLCREVREDFYHLYLSRAHASALDLESLPPTMRESLEDEIRNNFIQCDNVDGQHGFFNGSVGAVPEEAVISAFGGKIARSERGPAVTCWSTVLGLEKHEDNASDQISGAVYMDARNGQIFPEESYPDEGGYGHNSYGGAIYRQNHPLKLGAKELSDPEARRMFGSTTQSLIVNGPTTEFMHPVYRWVKLHQVQDSPQPIITIRTTRNGVAADMAAEQKEGEESILKKDSDQFTYIRSDDERVRKLMEGFPGALTDGQYDIWLQTGEEKHGSLFFCKKGTLTAEFIAERNADDEYVLRDAANDNLVLKNGDMGRGCANLLAFGGGADDVVFTGAAQANEAVEVQSIRFPRRTYGGKQLQFQRTADGAYELLNDRAYLLQTKAIVRSDGKRYDPLQGYEKAVLLCRKGNPNSLKILLSFDELMGDLDQTYRADSPSTSLIEISYHLRDTQRWNDSLFCERPEGYLAMAMIAQCNGNLEDAARILDRVRFDGGSPSREAETMLAFLARGWENGPVDDGSTQARNQHALKMKAHILLSLSKGAEANGPADPREEANFKKYLEYLSETAEGGYPIDREFSLPFAQLGRFADLIKSATAAKAIQEIRAAEISSMEQFDAIDDSTCKGLKQRVPQLINRKLNEIWEKQEQLKANATRDKVGAEITRLRESAQAARQELESLLNEGLSAKTIRAEDAAPCLSLIYYDDQDQCHLGKMHQWLHRLNPTLDAGQRNLAYEKVVDYAAAVAQLRFAEKLDAALESDGERIDYKAHPELTVPDRSRLGEGENFTSDKSQFSVQSALLFANFMADINPREEQIATFATAAARAGKGGMIIAPMGGGKTKVLIPIAVQRNASDGYLTVVEVLDSQYAGVGPDLSAALEDTSKHLIDVKRELGITDAASLTAFTTNRENLKLLADRLEAAAQDLDSAVLVTRDVLNRLLLAYENLLASDDLTTNQDKQLQFVYLSKIFKIFKKSRLTVDEAHKVFDPKESLIIASQSSGGTTAIAEHYRGLTSALYRLLAGGGEKILNGNQFPAEVKETLKQVVKKLGIRDNLQAANWDAIEKDPQAMYALAYYMAAEIKDSHGKELEKVGTDVLAFFIAGGTVPDGHTFGGKKKADALSEFNAGYDLQKQSNDRTQRGICEEILYARGMVDGGLAWISRKTYGNHYGVSADGQFIAKVYHDGMATNSDPADPLNLVMTYYASVATRGIPQPVLFHWINSQLSVALQQAKIQHVDLNETDQARRFAALIGAGRYQIPGEDGKLRDVTLADFYNTEGDVARQNDLYRAFTQACERDPELAFRLADRIGQNQLFTLPETREIRPSSVTKYFSSVEGFTGTPIFFGEMPATMATEPGEETVAHIENIKTRLVENGTPVESIDDYRIETSLEKLSPDELKKLTSVIDLAGMYYYSANYEKDGVGCANGEALARSIQDFYRSKGMDVPNVAFEGVDGRRWVLKRDASIVPLTGSGQKSYDAAQIQPGEQTIMLHSRPMGTGSDYPHPSDAFGIMLVNPNDNGLNEAMQAVMRFRGFTNPGWKQQYKILISRDLIGKVNGANGSPTIDQLIDRWKKNDEAIADAGVQQALLGELEHIPADVAMDKIMEAALEQPQGSKSVFTSANARNQRVKAMNRVVQAMQPFLSSVQRFDPMIYLLARTEKDFYSYFQKLCSDKFEEVKTALDGVQNDASASETERQLAGEILAAVEEKFHELSGRINAIKEKKQDMKIMAADSGTANIGDKNVEVEVETEKESEKESEEETERGEYASIRAGQVVEKHQAAIPEAATTFADYLRQGSIGGGNVTATVFGYDYEEAGEKRTKIVPAMPARDVLARSAQAIQFAEGSKFATSARYGFYAGVFPESGGKDFLDSEVLMSYDFIHSHENVLPMFHPDHAQAEYVVFFSDGQHTRSLIVSTREAEDYQRAIEDGRLTGCRIFCASGQEIATPKEQPPFEPDPEVTSKALAYLNMMRANTAGVVERDEAYATIVEEAGGDPTYLQRLNRIFILQKHENDDGRKKECLNMMSADSTLSTGIYFSSEQIEAYVKQYPSLKEPFEEFSDMGSGIPKYASLAKIGSTILSNDSIPKPISLGMARSLLLAVFSEGKTEDLDEAVRNLSDPNSVYSKVRQTLVGVRKLPPEAKKMVQILVYGHQQFKDGEALKKADLVSIETGKGPSEVAIASHAQAFLTASDAVVEFANYEESALQDVVNRAFEDSNDGKTRELQAARVRRLGQSGNIGIFLAAIRSKKKAVFQNLDLNELAVMTDAEQGRVFKEIQNSLKQDGSLLLELQPQMIQVLFKRKETRDFLINEFVNNDSFFKAIKNPPILSLFFVHRKCINRFQSINAENNILFQMVINELSLNKNLLESIDDDVIAAFLIDLVELLPIGSLFNFFSKNQDRIREVSLETMAAIDRKFTIYDGGEEQLDDELGLLDLFFQNNIQSLTDRQLAYIATNYILDKDQNYQDDSLIGERFKIEDKDGKLGEKMGGMIGQGLQRERLSQIKLTEQNIENVLIFTDYKNYEKTKKAELFSKLNEIDSPRNVGREKRRLMLNQFAEEYRNEFENIDREQNDGEPQINRQIRAEALILNHIVGSESKFVNDIDNWQSLAKEEKAGNIAYVTDVKKEAAIWDSIPGTVVNKVKALYDSQKKRVNTLEAKPYFELIEKLCQHNKLDRTQWQTFLNNDGKKLTPEQINAKQQNGGYADDLDLLIADLGLLDENEMKMIGDEVFALLFEKSAPGKDEKAGKHIHKFKEIVDSVPLERVRQVRLAKAALFFLACGTPEQSKQLDEEVLSEVAEEILHETDELENSEQALIKRLLPQNFEALMGNTEAEQSEKIEAAVAKILMRAAMFGVKHNENANEILKVCSEHVADIFVSYLTNRPTQFDGKQVEAFNEAYKVRYQLLDEGPLKNRLQQYFATADSQQLKYMTYDPVEIKEKKKLKKASLDGVDSQAQANDGLIFMTVSSQPASSIPPKVASTGSLTDSSVPIGLTTESIDLVQDDDIISVTSDKNDIVSTPADDLNYQAGDALSYQDDDEGQDFSYSQGEMANLEADETNDQETQTANHETNDEGVGGDDTITSPTNNSFTPGPPPENPGETTPSQPKAKLSFVESKLLNTVVEPGEEVFETEQPIEETPHNEEEKPVEDGEPREEIPEGNASPSTDGKPAASTGTGSSTVATQTTVDAGAMTDPIEETEPIPEEQPVNGADPADEEEAIEGEKPVERTEPTRAVDGATEVDRAGPPPSPPSLLPYVRTFAIVVTAASAVLLATAGMSTVGMIICAIIMALSFLAFALTTLLADGLPQPQPVESKGNGGAGTTNASRPPLEEPPSAPVDETEAEEMRRRRLKGNHGARTKAPPKPPAGPDGASPDDMEFLDND